MGCGASKPKKDEGQKAPDSLFYSNFTPAPEASASSNQEKKSAPAKPATQNLDQATVAAESKKEDLKQKAATTGDNDVKDKLNSAFKAKEESGNQVKEIIDRLAKQDKKLTEVNLNNAIQLSQKEEYFSMIASGLKGNTHVTSIELSNVGMKDSHCVEICESLKTCTNLVKLNMESNILTGVGIKAIAAMIEPHPTLRELRIDNQKKVAGIEAERSIANALSQNTLINKLSYTFKEKSIAVYVNKYVQRNQDIIRRSRVSQPVEMEKTPYPFQQKELSAEDKADSKVDDSAALTPVSFAQRKDTALTKAALDVKNIVDEVKKEEGSEDAAAPKFAKRKDTSLSKVSAEAVQNGPEDSKGPSRPQSMIKREASSAKVPLSETAAIPEDKEAAPAFGQVQLKKVAPPVEKPLFQRPSEAPKPDPAILEEEEKEKEPASMTDKMKGLEDTFKKKEDGENKVQETLARVAMNDPGTIELIANNQAILTQNTDLFTQLINALKKNTVITNLELANIGMKDVQGLQLVDALKNNRTLIKFNIESNNLTGATIKALAPVIEVHPTMKELRIDNQKNILGVEAERSIANALSQNTKITKLSLTCKDRSIAVYVNKFVQRNQDLVRKLRVSQSQANAPEVVIEPTPYPFPPTEAKSDAQSEPVVDTSNAVSVKSFVASRKESSVSSPSPPVEKTE